MPVIYSCQVEDKDKRTTTYTYIPEMLNFQPLSFAWWVEANDCALPPVALS